MVINQKMNRTDFLTSDENNKDKLLISESALRMLQTDLKELGQTNKKLLDEKNNLSKVMEIDRELTDGVVKGFNIEAIMGVVEKHIKKPVVVEDLLHQITHVKGFTKEEEYGPIKKEFQHILDKSGLIRTITVLQHSNCTRLVSPIYLQEKIVAYCSFFYKENSRESYETDTMIIRRVSTICSFILLNEKVELESMERMKGYLFEGILNGKYQSEQEIMRKTFFIHLDFTGGYYAVHLKYKESNDKYNMDPSYHNEIFENVTKYMSNNEVHVLMGQKTDSLLLLLPQKQLGDKTIQSVIYPFMSFLRKRLHDADWFVGISFMHSSVLEEVKEAFEEAETAVKLATKDNPVMFFHELGILGVAVNEENKVSIRKMAQLMLGNLIKDLDQSRVELVKTLYAFLTNGGNLEQTAEQMAISVGGLRYRLNKIADLIGRDFRDPESRFQLLLSLRALIVLDDEWQIIKE